MNTTWRNSVGKDEILAAIREGLAEYYAAKRDGRKLPAAADLLHEL